MADFLDVDIETLGRMVQLLRGSEQVLNDAMSAMKQDDHGSIGPTVLHAAADGFQRRWHYGLQQIGEHSNAVADGVSQCHAAYLEADKDFSDALNQVRSTIE